MPNQHSKANAAAASQKRCLTLDFNSAKPSAKRARLGVSGGAGGPLQAAAAPPILTTPDVQMLKLSSPELAKFLAGNNGLPTPTPSGLFPRTITEEQEMYAKGFEDALKNVQQQQQLPSGNAGSNAAAIATIDRATAAHRASLGGPSAAATAAVTNASNSSSRPPRPSSEASSSSEVLVKQEAADDDPDDVDEDDDDDDDHEASSISSNPSSALSPIDMESQVRE